MKILAIETSCDETAVSVIDARGSIENPRFKTLGNTLYSQVKLHEQYGGVFPTLAKREHAKNLPILLLKVLKESKLYKLTKKEISVKIQNEIEKILHREHGLSEQFKDSISNISKPHIDAIGVTQGPGLEPALWVGISFAKALGALWNIPVIPINHMEGHIFSVLMHSNKNTKEKPEYPALALLISGGHTEIVHIKKPLTYNVIGKTRDDAVGEAYDKVARMLSLPYPGGPEISKLAEKKRKEKYSKTLWNFPRPMIHTKDFDFSFSGLKTSVLYKINGKKLSQKQKEELSKEFEDAVTEVLITKSERAIVKYKPKSFIIGGGVIANTHIRSEFNNLIQKYKTVKLLVADRELATDNSLMIAITTFFRIQKQPNLMNRKRVAFKADGNLKL